MTNQTMISWCKRHNTYWTPHKSKVEAVAVDSPKSLLNKT